MITAFYASLCAILVIALALRVSKYRLKYRVGIGAGENRDLDIAIRCHANAVEILPIALFILLMAELQGLHFIALHVAGIVLTLSRILHPVGLTKGGGGTHFGRKYGTIISWLTVLVLAATNIVLFIVTFM